MMLSRCLFYAKYCKLTTRTSINNCVKRFKYHHSKPKLQPGLFSLESIQNSDNLVSASKEAILSCNKIRELISAIDLKELSIEALNIAKCDDKSKLQSLKYKIKDILILYDSISNIICKVIDTSELCRSVHSKEEFRMKAEESFSNLSTYINILNADVNMFNNLKALNNLAIQLNNYDANIFSSEDMIFMEDMLREFETGGIHLESLKDRKLAQEYQHDTMVNETLYMQNVSNDYKTFSFGPVTPPKLFNALDNWLSNYAIKSSSFNTTSPTKAGHLLCSTNKRISNTILASLEDENLRYQVWISSNDEPKENESVLGNLIKSRQCLAHTLGFKSHSHKFLTNKALKTPENVMNFINKINNSTSLQTCAEREIKILTDFKRKLIRQDLYYNNNDNNNDVTPILQPWDSSYLMSAYRSSQRTKEAIYQQEALTQLTKYLPLNACIDGLKTICKHLFGIEFEQAKEFYLNEVWNYFPDLKEINKSEKNSNNNVLSSEELLKHGILKFIAKSSEGKEIGIIYLDLFSRENKFPGAGHFTVQCGCLTSSSLTDLAISRLEGNKQFSSSSEEGLGQLPIVALVLNFPQPNRNQNSSIISSNLKSANEIVMPLLALSDMETLFHEWGHALHSLLSKTTYQHLSGTRGAVDFAEVPSHLFEYFARTPSVIAMFARHFQTNETPSLSLISDTLRTRDNFQAIELQNQLLYSAADQFIFGPDIGNVSMKSGLEIYDHALSGFEELQKIYTNIPLADFSSFHGGRHENKRRQSRSFLPDTSHSHFVHYGGGYYSYLFAKAYAAQIWDKRFEKDPLSSESGKLLWERMLQFGASKDCNDILIDVAGGELDPNLYFNKIFLD